MTKKQKEDKKKKNRTAVFWVLGLGTAGVIGYQVFKHKKGSSSSGSSTNNSTTGLYSGGRGLRNNNPLNLINTSINWQGEVPFSQKQDADFEEFTSPFYGIRANLLNFYNYLGSSGMKLEDIIWRWANGTKGAKPQPYIDFVVSNTRFNPTTVITRNINYQDLWAIFRAMAIFENGSKFQPEVNNLESDFSRAFDNLN